MARILILDRDGRSREQLERALTGQHVVSSTPMMRNACLILAQQVQDLAFVSLEEGSEAVTALRRFQPGLPIVLTTPVELGPVPDALQRQVQNTLVWSGDVEKARSIVQQLLGSSAESPLSPSRATAPTHLPRPDAITTRLEMEVESSGVMGLLLSRESDTIARAGAITELQATDIARNACEAQQAGAHGALLRFHLLRGSAVEVLLYTRSIGGGYLLTVVAPADSRLNALRAQFDRLVTHLEVAYTPLAAEQPGFDVGKMLLARETDQLETRSFALVWRPDTELPAVLLQPLRKALLRCARANEYQLTHAEVAPDYVSVVVQCPSDNDGARLAHILKQGTEGDIQQRLGVEVRLWEDGHLAREASQPFSQQVLASYIQGA